MGDKQRWPLSVAQPVAEHLRGVLMAGCERVEIAGSVRRGSMEVGDIELLCIPRATDNLFYADALDLSLKAMLAEGTLAQRPNTKGAVTYGPKNKLLVHVPSGIPVDVFSTDARNWGMSLVVRTGPAEFNVRMMARFKSIGFAGHAYGGVTSRNGEELDCPDEETVFRLLGWPFDSPNRRHSAGVAVGRA